MIPQFTDNGSLPVGIHRTNWTEFEQRFAYFDHSDRRFRLFEQLVRLVDEATKSGIVNRIIVAGSYVSSAPEPNDFDCILVLDPSIVGKVLPPFQYNLVSRRRARRLFGGDILPAFEGSVALEEYVAFFQTARNGQQVGVVEILV